MILTSKKMEKARENPKNKAAFEKTNEFIKRIENEALPAIKELGLEDINDLQAFLLGYMIIDALGQTETSNINAARAFVKCGFKGQIKEDRYLIMLEADDD